MARERIPVGVLGATGAVGQRFVQLLAHHPWFELAELAASDRSAGRPYAEACTWRLPGAPPSQVAALDVMGCAGPFRSRLLFSGLDASVAGEVEQELAGRGHAVVSNARNHRMDPGVPLLVPEVNPDHLDLIAERARHGDGYIVTNPNCSVVGLAMALAPLQRAFGIERLFVATMQAVSGAGYPGVPSLDILGNVIPFIGGEEEKMERETCKILGALNRTGVTPAPIAMSVHTNRVAVVDGHFEVVSVGLGRRATPEEAIAALREFRGSERVQSLPSSPANPVEVDVRPDRPQSRLDLERGGGMTVTVGRVRPCPVLDLRFALLSHNTIRGAAGAAVQIGELLVAEGYVSD